MIFSEGKVCEYFEFNPKETLKKNQEYRKIAMENITPKYKFIDNYSFEKYKGGSKFKNGDTIFARITPCLENGKIAYVDCLDDNEIAFGSTEYIVLRAIENRTIPEFVYYFAISDYFKNKAISLMTGTSGRQRVQTDALKELNVKIPDIINQKKIVRILSEIDKKIKLNNEINDNLLELSRQLYLDSFNNNSDFRKIKLGDLCNIKYGKGLPTTKILDAGYPVYGGNGIIGYYDSKMYDESQVLISCRGAASGKVILSQPYSFVTNNSLVLETDRIYHHFLKEYCFINPFFAYTTGSAQPQITIDNIKDIVIKIPDNNLLEDFNKKCNSIEEKYFLNMKQNEILSQLRDELLPKIMNGEIDLDKIEI